MSAFTVELDNQPGALTRLCEAMADRGVNLLLCGTTYGDSGVIAFIADDEVAAMSVLDSVGLKYLVRPALTVRMENSPGVGAATFRKLSDADVNVDLLLPVRISEELFYAVLWVSDEDAARSVLGDQVVMAT
jgi:hypothetical protein